MIRKVPNDVRGKLKLPFFYSLLIQFFYFMAKLFGFWDYPTKMYQENMSLLFAANWIYKNSNPVIKPEKKSGLNNYFKNELDKPFNLFPEKLKKEKSLTLSFVGDLMNPPATEQSKDILYENTHDLIFDADICCANLESTLTKTRIKPTIITTRGELKINISEKDYNAIKGHNNKKYSIFHLANNHILDCGWEGVETTVNTITKDNIKYFGLNLSEEDQKKSLIFNKNGFNIGFVGATYSLNHRKFPSGKEYLINYIPFHSKVKVLDISLLLTQIDYLKKQNCDFIIVSLHWGIEFEFFPNKKQLDITHELAEYGADLIISHHAHVIQPYEIYNSKRDPLRKIPIFYGLGNLISHFSSPHCALSLITNFKLSKTINNTYVDVFDIIPVFQLDSQDPETHFIKLEKLKEWHNKKLDDNELEEYVSKVSFYADLAIGERWKG